MNIRGQTFNVNGIQWYMWYLHTYFFHPVQLYLLLGWEIIILIFICLFAWLIWMYFLSLYIGISMVYFTILLETLKEIRASFWGVLQSNNTVIERNLNLPKDIRGKEKKILSLRQSYCFQCKNTYLSRSCHFWHYFYVEYWTKA